MRLPAKLSRAVAASSVTVQQLVYAVALHVEGLPDDLRSEEIPAPRDGCLESYLQSTATAFEIERAALGTALLAGRTQGAIAAFFDWQPEATKHKIKRLRQAAKRWHSGLA